MRNIVIATEVLSIVFLLIFLYSVFFEDKRKNLKKNLFIVILISWILALLIDIFSWIIVGNPKQTFALHMFTMVSYFMSGVETTAGAYYIVAHINSIQSKSFWYAHFIAIVNAVAIILMLGLILVGKTYSIETGQYIDGPMYVYVGCVSTFSLLYMIGLSIANKKILGKHDTIAFVIYLTIPMIATIIQCIWNELAFAYVAAAISAAILFAMLQSKEISDSRMREELLNKVSNMDALTGLNNRRAYDTFLKNIDEEVSLGAVFCDLNGLKYANDNYGHAEGDRLLCSFAKIMKKYFKKEGIFRISGDEFVILMVGASEEKFHEKVEEFRETLINHEYMAAIGAAYGNGKSVFDLISKAEDNMYQDKKYYYYMKGIDRRRS